jgi:hypothetical protein
MESSSDIVNVPMEMIEADGVSAIEILGDFREDSVSIFEGYSEESQDGSSGPFLRNSPSRLLNKPRIFFILRGRSLGISSDIFLEYVLFPFCVVSRMVVPDSIIEFVTGCFRVLEALEEFEYELIQFRYGLVPYVSIWVAGSKPYDLIDEVGDVIEEVII